MPDTPSPASAAPPVLIGLNAVLAIVENGEPRVLCTRAKHGSVGLPYGPFDPVRHRTLELGLRDWVSRQTQVELGYVEQLYTFGDEGREAPVALFDGDASEARIVSVGYLALAAEAAPVAGVSADWRSWYSSFPWEDWRSGGANDPTQLLTETIIPALTKWTDKGRDAETRRRRRERVALAYGFTDIGWEEERALERYELMYEAGLVEEAWRDRKAAGAPAPDADPAIAATTGAPMNSDHRRILATAIARLRGKLKYRAVIFELMPPTFTLLDLQRAVEGIVGFTLHKQNFRRSIENSGLVAKTGEMAQAVSGRPAALFELSAAAKLDRAAKGLTIPRLRRAPTPDAPA